MKPGVLGRVFYLFSELYLNTLQMPQCQVSIYYLNRLRTREVILANNEFELDVTFISRYVICYLRHNYMRFHYGKAQDLSKNDKTWNC